MDSIIVFALPGLSAIIALICAMALLLVSATISASEVAFFSLSPRDLESLDDEEDTRDETIKTLLGKSEQLMAAILVGNNLVNVAIIMLFTLFMNGIIDHEHTATWLIFVLETVILTFLLLLFGEILPKVYAQHNPLSFSRRVAPMMEVMERAFHPLVMLLVGTMGRMSNRLADRMIDDVTMDDLSGALELTQQVRTEEKKMLEGIIRFGDKSVKDAMTSRSEMVALEVDKPFSEVLKLIVDQNYSRIPVYRETEDHIEGILYIKDLLPYLSRDDHFRWQNLIRPAYYVPENKMIDDLLDDFRRRRLHMAIVVDEFGGTQGLITMEDVLEEIVGEIHDEYDEDVQTWQKVGRDEWIFEARTSLTDFYKVTNLSDEDFGNLAANCESIGGLILEIKRNFPRVHEVIRYKQMEFTIIAMDRRRIDRVRIKINRDN